MKRISTIQIGLLLILAAAVSPRAAAADERFGSFLLRFVTDAQFRMRRIHFPLSAKVGSSCDESEENQRWTREVFEKNFTSPLGRNELAAEGLSEEVTRVSTSEVRVFQYREEADSYLMTYTFKKIRGRWFLVYFEDGSC